ncbi:hypothetical protein A2967_01530 [Candidatus Daviesbacteria bacterium RIFCSPLOWO2_01_FULL_41_32]|uniref:Uncharacterized protein n=1 Tax=Candidatus Daviesbacteria bacterium RIFCSPHIGHO2_01_FULL_41_23 TaxID=1797764 RepID=A0A1F5IST1_9BACT|nr:MAG: hypothetical protein A2871_01045 [Candidatus Daviesbacteria bacterium RIFCSPHIGHO2_01_FULL_41_23]OGE62481.1 MAG: hypothetical protein A2967_01530 [Candidatus Daviesbacteria bacterium RIFCSPLOWO2_01_FULL_41_32]
MNGETIPPVDPDTGAREALAKRADDFFSGLSGTSLTSEPIAQSDKKGDVFSQATLDPDDSSGGPGTQPEAGRAVPSGLRDILDEQNPSGASPAANDSADAASEAAEVLALQPDGRGRRAGFLRRGLGKAGNAMGRAGEVAGGLGQAYRSGELSKAVGIGFRHYVENLDLRKIRQRDWMWRLGLGFGALESVAFVAIAPIPGANGLIKAGLNFAITQGGHYALNVARSRQELKAERIFAGDQTAIQARKTEIDRKYGGAHQKIKNFALGTSAGAMYLSLGSLFSEMGKEALGFDMQKMLQERFEPGKGTPAVPTETPGPKVATASPTPAAGPGGAPGGLASPTPESTVAPAVPSPTAEPSPVALTAPSPEPTVSPLPTVSPTAEPTVSPTPSPVPSPETTATAAPTIASSVSPTASPTVAPTVSPSPVPAPVSGPGGPIAGLDIGQQPYTPTKPDLGGLQGAPDVGKAPAAGLAQVPAPQSGEAVSEVAAEPTDAVSAPAPVEITPAVATSLPETMALPKGSSPWRMTSDYLEAQLGRPLNQTELSGLTKVVNQVINDNGIADPTKIAAGKSLNIHAVNEYLGQLGEGQSVPAVPVTDATDVLPVVDNPRAAEVGKVLFAVQDGAVKKALEQSDLTPSGINQAAVDKAHQAVQNALEIKANEIYDAAGSSVEESQKVFESWLASEESHTQLAKITEQVIAEQANVTESLTRNVSAVLVDPNLFTDRVIARGTNVGQMLHDAGYQITWDRLDADMLGAHIAANHDTLTEMWHQMAAHQNIPENPFPVGMSEINDLVAKAKGGDKDALRRLLAALRYVPEGQKFRILKKEGISAVLGVLG